MKLYAVSDLHLQYEVNREALARLAPHPDDWLAVAGDLGESEEHLRFGLEILTRRFARILWTPGNHDLWTPPSQPGALRGEAKYRRLVAICGDYGVLTPEDAYPRWPGAGPPCLVAPVFVLYDYSFRPDELAAEEVLAWAAETGIVCADEALLHPDPYPSREAWCAERCRYTEERLAAAAGEGPLVLVNHYPLRRDLLRLRRIPRFSPWCGTRRTEDWHQRFGARVVAYGHTHVRGSHRRDGVRFEEVSVGYPRDWDRSLGLEPYLRELLPGPSADATGGSDAAPG